MKMVDFPIPLEAREFFEAAESERVGRQSLAENQKSGKLAP
jgi:hypothetical protein